MSGLNPGEKHVDGGEDDACDKDVFDESPGFCQSQRPPLAGFYAFEKAHPCPSPPFVPGEEEGNAHSRRQVLENMKQGPVEEPQHHVFKVEPDGEPQQRECEVGHVHVDEKHGQAIQGGPVRVGSVGDSELHIEVRDTAPQHGRDHRRPTGPAYQGEAYGAD